MSYTETIRLWRALPPERKLRRRWDAIPLNVARSMAFAGEPVEVEMIRAFHAQAELPDLLKPSTATSATAS